MDNEKLLYRVVEEASAEELTKKVNELMYAGWDPTGSLAVTSRTGTGYSMSSMYYSQAMLLTTMPHRRVIEP